MKDKHIHIHGPALAEAVAVQEMKGYSERNSLLRLMANEQSAKTDMLYSSLWVNRKKPFLAYNFVAGFFDLKTTLMQELAPFLGSLLPDSVKKLTIAEMI